MSLLAAFMAELAAGMPDLALAGCRGQAPAFDVSHDTDIEQVGFALDCCHRCPELGRCRAWVDSLPPRQRPRGVVAGEVYWP